jgi:hypothetical protein
VPFNEAPDMKAREICEAGKEALRSGGGPSSGELVQPLDDLASVAPWEGFRALHASSPHLL